MNLVDGELSGGSVLVAGARLPVPPGDLGDSEIVVGVRPEYLTLHASPPAAAAIEGTVAVTETLGVSSLVTIECADGVGLGATVPEGAEPAVGSTVYATPQPGRLLLYSRDTGELLA
jgi:multiple sugar transport system ATP-binding protein